MSLSVSCSRFSPVLSVVAVALLLAACNGDDAASRAAEADAPALASATFTATVEPDESVQELAVEVAVPLYHLAPVDLAEPDTLDESDPAVSAAMGPHQQSVEPDLAQLSTRQLTRSDIESMVLHDGRPRRVLQLSGDATPMASGTLVSTYTPAQVRAAYGLPALPSAGITPTAAQAAQLGAGQTIYIVNAHHDPNITAELSTFNTRFGLPACTSTVLPPTASLPLPAASPGGCSLLIAYSRATGGLTSTPPAYEAGWATEIALDVQWAHATAPLARIVLIEAPDPSLNSLLAAVRLANSMGPGIVSMSFGAVEGSWAMSVDSAFTGTGMTYFAAAGDSGAQVNWPAVSPRVVAVGGSSLTWTGSAPRREVAWSLTGGARSLYVPAPGYQTGAVPGLLVTGSRAVADVAFNSDPSTGQYVATIAPGSTTAGWISAGGTSLAAPQWAGVAAIVNATRALSGQARLGAAHAPLYALATQPASYARAFLDITTGSNGSCGTCLAGFGYDLPTGLGTPNVAALVTGLAGTAMPTAPVVVGGTISGTAATPLSFAVTVTAANPVTYTLASAPPGVAISTAGQVTWASPIAGSYSVVVGVRDTVTGLAGQGTYVLSILAPTPPRVTAATLSATVGTAFNHSLQVVAANPVTWTLGGAPAGLSVSTAGVLGWTAPVAGKYAFTVFARDSRTGLTGQASLTLTVAAARPPVVATATVSGIANRALRHVVSATSPNALTYSLSGAPAGLAIDAAGVLTWAVPVAGRYGVTVTARDRVTGLAGSAVLTVSILPEGPVLSSTGFRGVRGRLMTGSIRFSNATSTSMSLAISGVPAGMSLALSGSTILATWTPPVTGTWTLTVSARDGNGRTATLAVPVIVTPQ